MSKIYLLLLLLSFSFFAAAQEICGDGIDNDNDGQIDEACQPFLCDGSLYQSAKQGNDFYLYKVLANPVQFIPISNLSQQGATSFNSLAYNPIDNLMYGMGTQDARLYRIDANGTVEFLGNVAGLNTFKNAGTFDNLGNYFVYGDNTLRKVDIANLTSTTIGNANTYGSADIVFNPLDNQIYGWSGGPKLLFKMDPSSGAQTIIPGNAPILVNNWGWVGALYFNAQGDILGYQGTKMIKFDPVTGIGTLAGTGSNKSSNDGCSCSFGVEMTKAVTGSFNPGDTISYHFSFFNQSFSPINSNLTFTDLLTDGFSWASNPYNLDNIQLSGNLNTAGSSLAEFTINNLPKGKSSFSIDAIIPCDYMSNSYTNQAILSNLPAPLKDSIWSDNPNTTTISDPTSFNLTTAPLVLNTTTTNIICEQSTGTIQLTAFGGAQPLSYLWSNGDSGLTATGLSQGTYTITISDANDCQVTISDSIVTENINLSTSISTKDVQCFGGKNGNIAINTSTGGYSPYVYSLNGTTYSSSTQFDSLLAGNYTLHTKDIYGCKGEESFLIIEPIFQLDIKAPNDTSLALGEELVATVLQNTITNVSYEWTPSTGLSCSNCQAPTIQAQTSTTYTIKGTDFRGCSDSTSFSVEVNEEPRAYIPNAFSPNDDGSNDYFMIYSPGDVLEVKSLRIFDRWGEMVFTQENFQPNYLAYAWDGRFRGQKMNTGVYIYFAEILLVNGKTEILTGDLNLLR